MGIRDRGWTLFAVLALCACSCGGGSSNSESSAGDDAGSDGAESTDDDSGDSDAGGIEPCAPIDDRFRVESVPVLEASVIANEIAFALTPDDRPAVAYRAMEDGQEKLVYVERNEAGEWRSTTLAGGPGHAGVSLGFSADGSAHVLHAANLPTPRTIMRVEENDTWTASVVSSDASSKNALFRALDGSVHGLVSEESVVQLVRPDGAGDWEKVWINTSSPDPVLISSSGFGIAGAYTNDGVLHASHAVVSGAMVHSSLEADSPTNEALGVVGNKELTAIAVAPQNELHIAFHREAPAELVIATRMGLEWSLTPIEPGASSAGLVVSAEGELHAFHIDENRNLRYGSANDPSSITMRTVLENVDRVRYALDATGMPHFVSRTADLVCHGRLDG